MAWVFGAFVGSARAATTDLPARLSLTKALELFHNYGFDVLLAEAAVESARGDALSAAAIPNPSLGLSVGKSFFTCAPASPGCANVGWGAQLSDQASIEDSLSGKRGLRKKVAQAALEAAKQGRADAERNLRFQVEQQYAQAALATASRDLAIEVQKSWGEALSLTQLRYKAGAISEADLARVQTAAFESDQALDQSRQALRQAEVSLAFLLGVRGDIPSFEVDPGLLMAPRSAAIASGPTATWLLRAEEHRPDLKAARDQLARADASLSLARHERFPDLALSLQYAQEGSGSGAIQPPTLTLGISAPLPLLYQQQGEVAKARADQHTQGLAAQKLLAQVDSDVEAAQAALITSGKLADRMEQGLLRAATRQRDLVDVQYRKGAASLLDYLDAQRTFVATRAEYLQDLTTYRVALFQLEQAVGEELQ